LDYVTLRVAQCSLAPPTACLTLHLPLLPLPGFTGSPYLLWTPGFCVLPAVTYTCRRATRTPLPPAASPLVRIAGSCQFSCYCWVLDLLPAPAVACHYFSHTATFAILPAVPRSHTHTCCHLPNAHCRTRLLPAACLLRFLPPASAHLLPTFNNRTLICRRALRFSCLRTCLLPPPHAWISITVPAPPPARFAALPHLPAPPPHAHYAPHTACVTAAGYAVYRTACHASGLLPASAPALGSAALRYCRSRCRAARFCYATTVLRFSPAACRVRHTCPSGFWFAHTALLVLPATHLPSRRGSALCALGYTGSPACLRSVRGSYRTATTACLSVTWVRVLTAHRASMRRFTPFCCLHTRLPTDSPLHYTYHTHHLPDYYVLPRTTACTPSCPCHCTSWSCRRCRYTGFRYRTFTVLLLRFCSFDSAAYCS